jgi:hypothetical protein
MKGEANVSGAVKSALEFASKSEVIIDINFPEFILDID